MPIYFNIAALQHEKVMVDENVFDKGTPLHKVCQKYELDEVSTDIIPFAAERVYTVRDAEQLYGVPGEEVFLTFDNNKLTGAAVRMPEEKYEDFVGLMDGLSNLAKMMFRYTSTSDVGGVGFIIAAKHDGAFVTFDSNIVISFNLS